MKKLVLTSSPLNEPGKPLNSQNRFAERLSDCVRGGHNTLFICSDPSEIRLTDYYSGAVWHAMELSGIRFDNYAVLDSRNEEQADMLVRSADLLILAGGHVPTQNAFFAKIGLRSLMQDYAGTVFGISAGSMNAADTVYAQPEEIGEADAPAYQRFLTGLNLTKTMLIPHYQDIKDRILDGKRIFEDITYHDSHGKRFYALCDGSYLCSDGVTEQICGEAYLIQDGMLRQICAQDETYIIAD